MFGGKAKKENEQLRQQVAQLQQRIAQLEQTIVETGAGDIIRIRDAHAAAIQSHEQYQQWALNQHAISEQQLTQGRVLVGQLSSEVDAVRKDLVSATDELNLQEFGLFNFPNPAEASVMLGEDLVRVQGQIKEAVRAKTAFDATSNFTFNNSAAKGHKFISDMSKMMIRAYNAEAENAVLTVRAGNLPAAIKRVERARDQAERLGKMIELQVGWSYHALRLEELRLTAQHLQAKQAAKDAEREERARLREEKKAQADMEAERKRLEKEKQHYENTIAALRSQGRLEEIADLEAKLGEINKGIEDVDYRAANVRAGYVYVISNVGSFGEKMVKIGMTRRLEPLDRVRELSDASVPFNFDVHAMFFAEDAVGVETELHRRFADKKVNQVNARREFFFATPMDVRDVLADIAGNLLEFRVVPEAEQFRESQRLAEALVGQSN